MNSLFKLCTFPITLLALSYLGACSPANEVESSEPFQVSSNAAVANKGYQKPGAPVRLVNGEPLVRSDLSSFQHRVTFASASLAGELRVDVAHSEGLTVAINGSSAMSHVFASDELGLKDLLLDIQPLAYGDEFVSFHIQTDRSARVISQVIKIVDPNAPANAADSLVNPQKATQGRGAIIPMKAQESIRP